MNSFQLKRRRVFEGIMLKRFKDLYTILKHPKIKQKIGEKVVQTIRIKKIFIVAMMLVTTILLAVMIMMT